MVDSILNDLKREFRSGHMVTRLIIINVAVFMLTALIKAFAPTFYNNTMIHWLGLPSSFMTLITRPWTLFTHMFVHAGFFHVLWNMLILHWFGRIVGDLIGDRHIFPLYVFGGLVGALSILVAHHIVPSMIGQYAIGASAGVMAIVIVAGLINPDHEMRLLFLGVVKIKFIVMAIIFFDLIGIGNQSNTGGHIAHIAGMLLGWYYLRQIGSKMDLGYKFDDFTDGILKMFSSKRTAAKKSPLKVKYKSEKIKTMSERKADAKMDFQAQVDTILDKIKKSGYDSLTEIEKETLFKASKK